jgi:hypothetical protein
MKLNDDLEGSSQGITEILSHNLPEGTEQNHERPIRIANVPAKIRNEQLLNKSQECYSYINPLRLTLV